MRLIGICALVWVVTGLSVLARDQPFQIVSWPDSGQAVLRFTFLRFKEVGTGIGRERTYVTDVTAENLSGKSITGASFSLYVFDKSKARIGEGYINLTNVAAGESVNQVKRILLTERAPASD